MERSIHKEERGCKGYDDYDWNELVTTGTIEKLLVGELDKYLTRNKLPLIGRKAQCEE